ncbi:Mediator of RNA polymerase II transcription subunit 10b [Abeliophyllum distichum]|uniref:Mediator of RNA polymerase II transcription subunit 10b n=1 Tax=Abeliophyllum distichum TaxID=126358 RepID=A0ABD1UIL5_9LAMI
MDSTQTTSATGAGGNGILISQSNDTPAIAATASTDTDNSKQNPSQAINSNQKTLGILHQLYLTVSSFNIASQVPLLQRIPLKAKRTHSSLRQHLLEELQQAFPDEVEAYREIREASAAESKRFAQAQSKLPNGDVKVKTEI